MTMALFDKLSIERNTHSTEKKTGVFVSSGAGVEGNMATGDHFRGVPGYSS